MTGLYSGRFFIHSGVPTCISPGSKAPRLPAISEMRQIKERHLFLNPQDARDFEHFIMRRFPFEAYKTRCDLITRLDGKTELHVSRWSSYE